MSENIHFHHSDGGFKAQKLVRELFLKHLRSVPLQRLMDSAMVPVPSGDRLAITTQSCVVQPIFFPGGDIGRLSVLRAVNNLASEGASPRIATISFILEEGLSIKTLEQVVISIAKAAAESTIEIVAGDTRVVKRGDADKIYISVTAIGVITEKKDPSLRKIDEGDLIIINGSIAEHGAAVLLAREGEIQSMVRSDMCSLHKFARSALKLQKVKKLKDISRGGLATALVSLAKESALSIEIEKQSIPVNDAVNSACLNFGLDPIYVPSAGKILAIVAPGEVNDLIREWSILKNAQPAVIIGRIKRTPRGSVLIKDKDGELRRLELRSSSRLQRIG
ncbi:MAG: hydrogenase expression/formation protein HypE [Candidatus Electryonea clarkiae]|nr:hydrogenase expression/formation protein HypE [Candidatus Electryonea clarkiae]MDP8287008.1 hydrogenase expression/formation protein HypE [Candidatus Electryonea clarkiae]